MVLDFPFLCGVFLQIDSLPSLRLGYFCSPFTRTFPGDVRSLLVQIDFPAAAAAAARPFSYTLSLSGARQLFLVLPAATASCTAVDLSRMILRGSG